jgi:hypothetical protein
MIRTPKIAWICVALLTICVTISWAQAPEGGTAVPSESELKQIPHFPIGKKLMSKPADVSSQGLHGIGGIPGTAPLNWCQVGAYGCPVFPCAPGGMCGCFFNWAVYNGVCL